MLLSMLAVIMLMGCSPPKVTLKDVDVICNARDWKENINHKRICLIVNKDEDVKDLLAALKYIVENNLETVIEVDGNYVNRRNY